MWDKPGRATGDPERTVCLRGLLVGLLVVGFIGTGRARSQSEASPPPDLQTFDRDLNRYYALLQGPGLAVGVARGDRLIYALTH